jgi:hypothetical protein
LLLGKNSSFKAKTFSTVTNLGEVEKVKLPLYKGFSACFGVAEKWIKLSLD